MNNRLQDVLLKNRPHYHQVVRFNTKQDRLIELDFTVGNTDLDDKLIGDTELFAGYIAKKLADAKAQFGIGGYDENRVLYRRSAHFDALVPRSVHLGIDIWGPVGTKVYTPVGGMVHSFAYNDAFGDYGATIILQHQLDTIAFHTLYGHLSLQDLAQLHEGQYLNRGEVLGHFGGPEENGNWPPHLHFQIIEDMRINEGDYPGVCSITERDQYLSNCPNPDLILDMMRFANEDSY